jgi:mono/diheme cytochrome c family protein
MATALSASLLVACVSLDDGESKAAARGKAFAKANCAACHAIGATGDSPMPRATPFRQLGSRYDARRLEREFEAISEVGHYEMPSHGIAPGARQDLAAFILSLR